MLESVISAVPVLFLKMGQEEAGAIDFKLTYTDMSYVNGNRNFQADDPFLINSTTGASYTPLSTLYNTTVS